MTDALPMGPDGRSRVPRGAVVGCGAIGSLLAEEMAGNPTIDLVGLCDQNRRKSDELARKFGAASFDDLTSMLRSTSPDIVAVATPDDAHREPVLAALEYGCAVFCEKPLATTTSDAETMVAAADKAERPLGVDFNRRFGFSYATARQLLVNDQIGPVDRLQIDVVDGFPPRHVRTSPTAMLTTLLTHHFDLARWLLGEVKWVHASGPLDARVGLVTPMTIAVEFANGVGGEIVGSYCPNQTQTVESMRLSGPQGAIQTKGVCGDVTCRNGDGDICQTWTGAADPTAFWKTIGAHLRVFVASAAAGETPPVTGRDGLASLRIAAAAAKSWETGRSVEVKHAF